MPDYHQDDLTNALEDAAVFSEVNDHAFFYIMFRRGEYMTQYMKEQYPD
jgi:hypothetical protein